MANNSGEKPTLFICIYHGLCLHIKIWNDILLINKYIYDIWYIDELSKDYDMCNIFCVKSEMNDNGWDNGVLVRETLLNKNTNGPYFGNHNIIGKFYYAA